MKRLTLLFAPMCIFCTSCANQPAGVREVQIPIPVTVSCPSFAKPAMIVPKDDSRVEWLRSRLINDERMAAYVKELEATLEACN